MLVQNAPRSLDFRSLTPCIEKAIEALRSVSHVHGATPHCPAPLIRVWYAQVYSLE